MTRVLFTHSYSMTQVRALCELGEYPRHHLWGADALERAGFDVRYGFFGGYRRTLRRLSESLGGRLGDIEQEAEMWRAARGHTVVYAAEANVVRGLTALPRAGRRDRPRRRPMGGRPRRGRLPHQSHARASRPRPRARPGAHAAGALGARPHVRALPLHGRRPGR